MSCNHNCRGANCKCLKICMCPPEFCTCRACLKLRNVLTVSSNGANVQIESSSNNTRLSVKSEVPNNGRYFEFVRECKKELISSIEEFGNYAVFSDTSNIKQEIGISNLSRAFSCETASSDNECEIVFEKLSYSNVKKKVKNKDYCLKVKPNISSPNSTVERFENDAIFIDVSNIKQEDEISNSSSDFSPEIASSESEPLPNSTVERFQNDANFIDVSNIKQEVEISNSSSDFSPEIASADSEPEIVFKKLDYSNIKQEIKKEDNCFGIKPTDINLENNTRDRNDCPHSSNETTELGSNRCQKSLNNRELAQNSSEDFSENAVNHFTGILAPRYFVTNSEYENVAGTDNTEGQPNEPALNCVPHSDVGRSSSQNGNASSRRKRCQKLQNNFNSVQNRHQRFSKTDLIDANKIKKEIEIPNSSNVSSREIASSNSESEIVFKKLDYSIIKQEVKREDNCLEINPTNINLENSTRDRNDCTPSSNETTELESNRCKKSPNNRESVQNSSEDFSENAVNSEYDNVAGTDDTETQTNEPALNCATHSDVGRNSSQNENVMSRHKRCQKSQNNLNSVQNKRQRFSKAENNNPFLWRRPRALAQQYENGTEPDDREARAKIRASNLFYSNTRRNFPFSHDREAQAKRRVSNLIYPNTRRNFSLSEIGSQCNNANPKRMRFQNSWNNYNPVQNNYYRRFSKNAFISQTWWRQPRPLMKQYGNVGEAYDAETRANGLLSNHFSFASFRGNISQAGIGRHVLFSQREFYFQESRRKAWNESVSVQNHNEMLLCGALYPQFQGMWHDSFDQQADVTLPVNTGNQTRYCTSTEVSTLDRNYGEKTENAREFYCNPNNNATNSPNLKHLASSSSRNGSSQNDNLANRKKNVYTWINPSLKQSVSSGDHSSIAKSISGDNEVARNNESVTLSCEPPNNSSEIIQEGKAAKNNESVALSSELSNNSSEIIQEGKAARNNESVALSSELPNNSSEIIQEDRAIKEEKIFIKTEIKQENDFAENGTNFIKIEIKQEKLE